MSKAIKRNTEALQTFYNKRNRITQATRTKVQNIITYIQIVRLPNSPQQTILLENSPPQKQTKKKLKLKKTTTRFMTNIRIKNN